MSRRREELPSSAYEPDPGAPAPPHPSAPLGQAGSYRPGQWVQTERAAHEAWMRLTLRHPAASALLHRLVASMGHQNAVVVSQATLAKLIGKSVDTIQRALTVLMSERWIQVVRIGKGKEAAYVVNDRVAWGGPRAQLRLSVFSAQVVADAEDQDTAALDTVPLRRIPSLYPGEQQLPAGPGEPPPSQPTHEGMEPDLPALEAGAGHGQVESERLEAREQSRLAAPKRPKKTTRKAVP